MQHDTISHYRQTDVSVLFAEEEHLRPGAVSGTQVHSNYIIECCTTGKGTVTINGKTFSIRPGDCYVLLPGVATQFRCDREDPRGGYWCVLEGFEVAQVLKQTGITPETPFLPPALFESIKWWLQLMAQHWPCKDAGAQLRQTACAYGLLGALLQNRPAPDNTGLIDKAVGYMQANYYEDVSVEQIARQAGLERTYFSHLFKEKTGQTPHRYLTQIRIRKACQLLELGKYTVSEVSYLVGLAPHNFSRQFKQELGITAQQYVAALKSGTITTGSPAK